MTLVEKLGRTMWSNAGRMLSSVNWCVTLAKRMVTIGLIPPGVLRSPIPLQT